MKKRVISILLGVTMFVTSMTGCGASSSVKNEISVVSREDGSGTRGAFVELFGIEEEVDGEKVDMTYDRAEITNSTSVMMTTIEGNINGIGYVSLGVLNDLVKAVKIDGAIASAENIENGSYTISRPFNIVTKNDVSDVTKDFIDFIMSKEGQNIVVNEKYISVDSETASTNSKNTQDIKYVSNKASGIITIAGSSSVAPLMEALKEAYVKVNPGATIELQQNDSTTGINSVIEGICDIGMASRELKEEEKSGDVVSRAIAMDGIAVIVNKGNKVDELSSSQVKDIFTGKVTSWEDVRK